MEEEPERGEYYVHPLIVGRRCADCGKWLGKEAEWFTCSTCGKTICMECRTTHIPRCMALSWGLAKKDPETGELIPEEKPIQLAW